MLKPSRKAYVLVFFFVEGYVNIVLDLSFISDIQLASYNSCKSSNQTYYFYLHCMNNLDPFPLKYYSLATLFTFFNCDIKKYLTLLWKVKKLYNQCANTNIGDFERTNPIILFQCCQITTGLFKLRNVTMILILYLECYFILSIV